MPSYAYLTCLIAGALTATIAIYAMWLAQERHHEAQLQRMRAAARHTVSLMQDSWTDADDWGCR